MMQPIYLTPSDTNNLIKITLEDNPIFRDLWITGELSNVKYYAQSKITYFSLTDNDSQINCVLYGTFSQHIPFQLENGLHVSCRGKISVFHKRGSYSYQVAFMSKAGVGDKSKALEALKLKLEKEGLFDPAKKKRLPTYATNVAIITSFPSAASSDVIKQFNSLAPHIKLTFIPTTVQGDKAVASILSSLTLASHYNFDCLCLIRGGGSAEDLDVFNNETLLRELSFCPFPLITAIGHEQDTSLADLVADRRCSTPTEAAIMISSPYVLLKESLAYKLDHTSTTLKNELDDYKNQLTTYLERHASRVSSIKHSHNNTYSRVMKAIERANPLNKFKQGFSICAKENGEKITSISTIKVNDILNTTCIDGVITSKVSYVKKNNSFINSDY